MKNWYSLVESSPREAAVNMALDQHLLEAVDAGLLDGPLLRIYAWERPTLSLGYHQSWRETVNPAALAEHGVVLVRRWTGGRAVLHDHGEITYSFIAPAEAPFSKRVDWNYRLIGKALHRFTDLGSHRGNISPGTAAETSAAEASRQQRHAPCFASLSPAEIEETGKKLIGSAQKIGKWGFLQHGSIPLQHRPAVLEAITGTDLDMGGYMSSLADHYAKAGLAMPPRETLVERLVRAFERQFQVTFKEWEHLPEEAEVARHAQRFRSEAWTFRK